MVLRSEVVEDKPSSLMPTPAGKEDSAVSCSVPTCASHDLTTHFRYMRRELTHAVLVGCSHARRPCTLCSFQEKKRTILRGRPENT